MANNVARVQENIRSHFTRTLNRLRGTEKREVEAQQMGIGFSNYKRILKGEQTTEDVLAELFRYFGPELANAWMERCGMAVIPIDPDEHCPFHTLSESSGFVSELAKMLEDGRLDHLETPEARKKAFCLGVLLLQFSQGLA